jgi:ABC-2 type transport system permease protein
VSALAVLDAERIKLSTTRSPLWSAVGVAVLSLGLAALQGATAYDFATLPPQKAAMGVAIFGVPVLMILSSMAVTCEYRSGTIRTTFMSIPNLALVLVAKAIVAAVFSGVYGAVMVIGSIFVARAVAKPFVGSQLSLSEPASWRTVGAIALYAALAAVLGVGVGALLRAAAGAVAVLLLWPLVAEPILGNLPSVSSEVGPYLPFGNILLFIDVQWLYPAYAMPWGTLGSLAYFTVVVAVVFGAAVVVLNRRDA